MANQTLEDIIQLELEKEKELEAVAQEIKTTATKLRTNREKLYKRRQELVSGKALPTQEELQEWHDSHDDAAAGGASFKGVPYYYLTVLCNQDTLAEEISSRDKQALSFCTAMRATWPSKGAGPPTLEMSFSANPFFTNSLLKRCLGDPAAGVEEVTTDIQWKDTAHKLTVKEVTKKSGGKQGGGKGKKGGKGKGGGGSSSSGADEPAVKAKFKPCASFFQFFMPDVSGGGKAALHPAMLPFTPEDDDESEEGGEEKSAKQERDELIMGLLLEQVLPKATTLYLAGPLQAPSDEDDEDFQVVHGPVGDSAADLPPASQKVLAALQHNQGQLDALEAQWQAARSSLKAQQSKLRVKLAQERRALLLPPGSSETRVPRFWLRVLKAADAAALAISPRDAAVLAALADVRFSLDATPGATELQGKWELEFLPNKFLVAADGAPDGRAVLVKSYTFDQGSGSDRLLHSKVVAAPKWASPSTDPTHKVGRDGKQRPASSIFQLFKAQGGKYAFNLAGSGKEVQDEANELERELLQELFRHLLLEAGQVYKQRQQDGWHDEDTPAADQAAWDAAAAAGEADSEEEDSDLEEGESDDETEAAHKAALRRAKQRRSWKPSKGEVLMILVGMMLLGELFVMLDMLGLFNRRR